MELRTIYELADYLAITAEEADSLQHFLRDWKFYRAGITGWLTRKSIQTAQTAIRGRRVKDLDYAYGQGQAAAYDHLPTLIDELANIVLQDREANQ